MRPRRLLGPVMVGTLLLSSSACAGLGDGQNTGGGDVVTKGRAPVPCTPRVPATTALTVTLPNSGAMAFDSDCYAVVANQPFTIALQNRIVAESGAPGPTQNISIYPSQNSAYSLVDGGVMVGPDNRAQALFIGDDVAAPGIITYRVPPLPAGTYWMQSDFLPTVTHATLVVE